MQELVGHLREAFRERGALQDPVLLMEALERHDGFRHGAMAARRSDLGEPALDELAGVS